MKWSFTDGGRKLLSTLLKLPSSHFTRTKIAEAEQKKNPNFIIHIFPPVILSPTASYEEVSVAYENPTPTGVSKYNIFASKDQNKQRNKPRKQPINTHKIFKRKNKPNPFHQTLSRHDNPNLYSNCAHS